MSRMLGMFFVILMIPCCLLLGLMWISGALNHALSPIGMAKRTASVLAAVAAVVFAWVLVDE